MMCLGFLESSVLLVLATVGLAWITLQVVNIMWNRISSDEIQPK